MAGNEEPNYIKKATLTSLKEGVVEFARDWHSSRLPRVSMKGRGRGGFRLKAEKLSDYAVRSHYYVDAKERAVFVFDTTRCSDVHVDATGIYLAGSFNGWQDAIGQDEWLLKPKRFSGGKMLSLTVPLTVFDGSQNVVFKFVTEDHHWFEAEADAPNLSSDSEGTLNYRFDPKRTGRHRYMFTLSKAADLSESNQVLFLQGKKQQVMDLEPGPFFYELSSEKELGAIVGKRKTTFRLFAPRAKWVEVGVMDDLGSGEPDKWIPMRRAKDFVWEVDVKSNLAGCYYWYRLDGPSGPTCLFDPEVNVLDPYAKAVVSRDGPGIVVDDDAVETPVSSYSGPAWHDLVILEAHVRDLVARTRFAPTDGSPIGFRHLSAFAESEDFYPSSLGVNALELQPIQENDSESPQAYHWGYMTSNFFAPASSYGSDPSKASQVEEFREAVGSIHKRDLAVILDVVYNHVGEPAHLMRIDKLYYFDLNKEGYLMNWSGCGNDLRTESAMATRLIIDSLSRLVSFYGVDGFRFDLADLVGKPVLQKVERALKKIKPDIVLIAEPWSFKSHIGPALRDTGYASWNDGYREAIKKYVNGNYGQDGFIYFLKGSPEHYATWPAQTVNYVESHDDRVWIDNITERENHDGTRPTLNDIHRTHMMVAILMSSVGIPMLHAGMDFLVTKNGVNNTYLDGERNALDYRRGLSYPSTWEYFRQWIAFRQSKTGELLRHFSRPREGYFDFIRGDGNNAIACVINANGEKGPVRLIVAFNPNHYELELSLGKWTGLSWGQIADHQRFWGESGSPVAGKIGDTLYLPSLGCGLWMA